MRHLCALVLFAACNYDPNGRTSDVDVNWSIFSEKVMRLEGACAGREGQFSFGVVALEPETFDVTEERTGVVMHFTVDRDQATARWGTGVGEGAFVAIRLNGEGVLLRAEQPDPCSGALRVIPVSDAGAAKDADAAP